MVIIFAFIFNIYFVKNVLAVGGLGGLEVDVAKQKVTDAIAGCQAAVMAAPLPETCTATSGTFMTSNTFTCTGGTDKIQMAIAAQTAAFNKCVAAAEKKNADLIKDSDWNRFKKDLDNQFLWASKRTGFAAALKTSLSAFAKTMAYETATWVASGGKGQKPLFITEGWDVYLGNAADSALGNFIDLFMRNGFGVDMCAPDFNVKLAIAIGINWQKPVPARCHFSTIVSNWQAAIANPNFSLDFNSTLRPGENSISVYLLAQSRAIDRVDYDLWKSYLKVAPEGFKSVTDLAGKILTPSQFVTSEWLLARSKASAGQEIFTNTVWDFVDTFVSTLVGKLLQNLMAGFFSDDQGASGARSRYQTLYNAESEPFQGGAQAAQNQYLNFITGELKVGESYDILNNLSNCTEAVKANPGPTDCVLDPLLVQAIREKQLVMNLSASIKDRPFAPRVEQVTNPQTVFTLRNITILRKYRIVPVGWEVAAKYINQYGDKDYTLRQLIAAFDDQTSIFKGLVDPFWVMKAPALFCRRQGYGPDLSNRQDNAIDRAEYCADEQQCIEEDDNGNCLKFGYCAEEKREWDFNGKKCEPRFNTCQTYTPRMGNEISYLANTLDYRNCNAQNVGCRWYSGLFNPVSDYWLNTSPTKTLKVCSESSGAGIWDAAKGGCTVQGENVLLWHGVSPNNKVILNTPCNTANVNDPLSCRYDDVSCTIPKGGVYCRVNQCFESNNLLTNLNGNFSSCDGWDARYWLEGYEVANKRHACALGQGRSGTATDNALEAYSIGDNSAIITTLPNITQSIEANKKYSLTFYARGNLVQGAISVDAFGGNILGGITLNSGNTGNNWKSYEFEFTNQSATILALRITTIPGTVGTVYFDDFDLRKVNENCAKGSVWLTLGAEAQDKGDIFFDKDAQSCGAEVAGCNQFIRTKAGLGSNLVYNPGFEISQNNNPVPGWEEQGYCFANGEFEVSGEKVRGGQSAIKITTKDTFAFCQDGSRILDYKAYVFSTNQKFHFEAGKKYAISAWVFSNSNPVAFGMDMDYLEICQGRCASKITKDFNDFPIFDGSKLNQWQRISFVFEVNPDSEFDGVVRFPIWSEKSVIYIDDVKVEELAYDSNSASDYTPYNPAERPADQLTYLKKAPDYYSCYLTPKTPTANPKWPETKLELLSVLDNDNRSFQCANYTGVCTPEEVGCDLYRPLNKDPSIPAVINSGDVCPAPCLGYETYLQEETDFASPNYTQFIADKTPLYCSAGYAGCDQFTNLDKVAQGGEGLEYYVNLRPCQRIEDGSDGANYYTWEGSDVTGYQLKAFKLKTSQSASLAATAPCANLFYYQTGTEKSKNYCDDPENLEDIRSKNTTLGALLDQAIAAVPLDPPLVPSDLTGYLNYLRTTENIDNKDVLNQDIVNEMHKFGLCVKQELHGYFYDSYVDNPGDNPFYISVVPNPDCREFYDLSGNISYRLLSKTVSISDNCKPERRTKTQPDKSVSCPALVGSPVVPLAQCDCASKQGYWNDNGECIYMAVPGEGLTCPAQFAKCREYTGNQGYNVRNIFLSDFEQGADYWSGGTLSSAANYPGGSSLTSSEIIKRNVFLIANKTYLLSFWAKGGDNCTADNPCELKEIRFSRAANVADYFAVNSAQKGKTAVPAVQLYNEWRKYDLGPVFMSWANDGGQYLEINAGGTQLYIDNILLKEVQDNLFLVENSWFTPVACDNKLADPSGEKMATQNNCGQGNENKIGNTPPYRCFPGEMVGCSSYYNQDDQSFNLKSFNKLCRPEAVGCEALFETHNSDSPFGSVYNENDISQVRVATDTPVYLVNDRVFSCAAADKGCTAYGLPKVNNRDEVVGYNALYLKNLPDQYSTALCRFNELWCESFTGDRAASYFKDPRDKVCVNQYITGTSTEPIINRWVKQGSNEPCDVSPYQTMGQGVRVEKLQPIGWFDNRTGLENNAANENITGYAYDGWAGSCPAGKNSCTEYLDPLAKMYTNLVYNGDFEQDVDNDEKPDGWAAGVFGTAPMPNNSLNHYAKKTSQRIKLQPHTLYTLSAFFGPGANSISVFCGDDGSARLWSPDTSATSTNNQITITRNVLSAEANISGRFYYEGDVTKFCVLDINKDVAQVDTAIIDNVKLVKTGVYYNLNNTINRTACNGLVDFKTGCVLFNDRGQINYNESNNNVRVRDNYLTFDVDKTEKNQPQPKQPALPEANLKEQKNADSIIKVSPDRQCAQWLYCNTYEKAGTDISPAFGSNDRCLNLSLCSSVNESGECDNLLVSGSQVEQKYSEQQLNKTGYSMVGADIAGKSIRGYYPYQLMYQVGESVEVPNGGFDSVYTDRTEPVGWYPADSIDDEGWKEYKYSVETLRENRRDSVGYLRLNSVYMAQSDYIDVNNSMTYVFSGWMHTKGLNPKEAQARVLIKEYKGDGSIGYWQGLNVPVKQNMADNLKADYILTDAGQGWKYFMVNYTPTADTRRIRIVLENFLDKSPADGNCDNNDGDRFCDIKGSSLFDDISLKPVLKVNEAYSISRSCRLYPERDSLSCKYMKDQNLFYGWYGFCLTKDPQNPNQCLQWWPIETPEGETLDEVTYYEGMVPLYYCLTAQMTFDTEYRKQNWTGDAFTTNTKTGFSSFMYFDIPIVDRNGTCSGVKISGKGCNANTIPTNDQGCEVKWFEVGRFSTYSDGADYEISVLPLNSNTWSDYFDPVKVPCDPGNSEDGDGWFLFDIGQTPYHAIRGIKLKLIREDKHGGSDFNNFDIKNGFKGFDCREVVKTVTETGANKAWASRTAKGSVYQIPPTQNQTDVLFNYQTDYSPFGAMTPPEPINNPLVWNGSADVNNKKPISTESGSTVSGTTRAGSPYKVTASSDFNVGDNFFGRCSITKNICVVGADKFFACPANENCVNVDDTLLFESATAATDMLKRIFARYFGFWEWTAYPTCVNAKCVCKGSAGCVEDASCEANNNCQSTARCDDSGTAGTWRCQNIPDRVCTKDSDCAISTGYKEVNPSETIRNWDIPTSPCALAAINPDGTRIAEKNGPDSNYYCYIKPRIVNILVNDDPAKNDIIINANSAVKLGFTVFVDPDQLPLTYYKIDWGDGSDSTVSGASLRDRSDINNNPFTLYHHYDYWGIKGKNRVFDYGQQGDDGIYCEGER
ncbi:MAG: hypothetical protein WC610_02080, partial [Patescibacteria group bacterium]